MNCPSCRGTLLETQETCDHCGFSLAVADQQFGTCQAINTPLHVDADGFRPGNALLRALRRFHHRFPQLRLSFLVRDCPEEAKGDEDSYLFWIFNRSGLNGAMDQGGKNLRILVWLDPSSPALRATIGYGLEPWLTRESLEGALSAGGVALRRQNLPQAVDAVLTELSLQLAQLAESLPKQFGIVEDTDWVDAADSDLDSILSPAPSAPVY